MHTKNEQKRAKKQFFSKKNRENACQFKNNAYLCIAFNGKPDWAFSSAGSEHLPYKQRVGGSNPSTPTNLTPS